MRAALIVNRVWPDVEANRSAIVSAAHRAADAGAELVLFPEAALTGLINNDDPMHDLPLGQPIPGPFTAELAALAHERGIHLAIGLLERDGGRLYDSAVLMSPAGEVALHYRRIQPQWHGKRADSLVYCQGTELPKVQTALGSMALLLCGDLFDDGLVQRVRALRPDWLLFPFARCFGGGGWDQRRWDEEERATYIARVRMVGATTLMVNYLADKELEGGAFGGAMVVSGDGELLASLPLGEPGMLLVEV